MNPISATMKIVNSNDRKDKTYRAEKRQAANRPFPMVKDPIVIFPDSLVSNAHLLVR